MRKISARQAYRIGQQDAMYGLSLTDNPWPVGDERHSQWVEGWHVPQDGHGRVHSTFLFDEEM